MFLFYLVLYIISGWGVFISFTATNAAAAKLFIYNRTTAMGIMLAGGSLGVITYPFLFQYLLRQYTLRGVMLILAGLYLNFLTIASLVFFVEKDCRTTDTVEINKVHEIDIEIDRVESSENKTFTGTNDNTKELLEEKNVNSESNKMYLMA